MDRLALRNRLRDINIEHSALLKNKTQEDHFLRIAQLKNERAMLMRLLTGDGALRLVADQGEVPVAHRQSA